MPPRLLLALLYDRLVAHTSRHGAAAFPVLDVTDITWLLSREELLAHLADFPDAARYTQRVSQLRLLRARVCTCLVLC